MLALLVVVGVSLASPALAVVDDAAERVVGLDEVAGRERVPTEPTPDGHDDVVVPAIPALHGVARLVAVLALCLVAVARLHPEAVAQAGLDFNEVDHGSLSFGWT